MRRAALITSVLLCAAGAPASAHGAPNHGAADHGAGHGPGAATGTHSVAIANRAFSPARITALVGDSVSWRNDDLMIHNVTASAAAIASGTLNRGSRFTHRFGDAGAYPYVCTIHPFMQGRVDVHPALLEVASSSVLAGGEVPVHGRTVPGGDVTIEQRAAGAGAFTPLITLRADATGAFHGAVRPQATTAYRAVNDRGASPAVTVTVAAALRVTVTARRGDKFTKVDVRAPGGSGATATLQLYSRERFSWFDRRRHRLGATGRTVFRLRPGLRYHARVVVSGHDGVVLGTSRSVKLPR